VGFYTPPITVAYKMPPYTSGFAPTFCDVTPKDLNGLKIKVMEEGMPYQTLVSSIIHKYLSGRLTENEI